MATPKIPRYIDGVCYCTLCCVTTWREQWFCIPQAWSAPQDAGTDGPVGGPCTAGEWAYDPGQVGGSIISDSTQLSDDQFCLEDGDCPFPPPAPPANPLPEPPNYCGDCSPCRSFAGAVVLDAYPTRPLTFVGFTFLGDGRDCTWSFFNHGIPGTSPDLYATIRNDAVHPAGPTYGVQVTVDFGGIGALDVWLCEPPVVGGPACISSSLACDGASLTGSITAPHEFGITPHAPPMTVTVL